MPASKPSLGRNRTASQAPPKQIHRNLDWRGKTPPGGFKPGISGNPAGRPRAVDDVSAICRRYGPEAVKRVVAAMRNPDDKIAVPACIALLDRGYGKPVQPLHSDNQSTVLLHLIAAQTTGHELIAEMKPTPALAEPPVIDATAMPTE